MTRAQHRLPALVQLRLARLAVVRARGGVCVLAALVLCQCTSLDTAPPSEVLSYGRFERIYVYRPEVPAKHLALLLSGDGGWSSLPGSIAQRLAAGGTLVAGIDVRHLLASLSHDRAPCVSPASEFEALAHHLQQHYHLGPAYVPVLIGHSAGGTLAFVALAQSQPGMFAGALTLSFCADLDLRKPLCPDPGVPPLTRSGGVRLRPPRTLPAGWIALHGLDDEVCPVTDSREFAGTIPTARFVPLPGVDHDYRHTERWWPDFQASLSGLLAHETAEGAEVR